MIFFWLRKFHFFVVVVWQSFFGQIWKIFWPTEICLFWAKDFSRFEQQQQQYLSKVIDDKNMIFFLLKMKITKIGKKRSLVFFSVKDKNNFLVFLVECNIVLQKTNLGCFVLFISLSFCCCCWWFGYSKKKMCRWINPKTWKKRTKIQVTWWNVFVCLFCFGYYYLNCVLNG